MAIPFFDGTRQLSLMRKEIDEAIARVLVSGKFLLGKETENFEQEFATYIGTTYAVGVNSGTDAIKIALRSIGIKKDDEVITVANTAIPTVSAIRETGATPVLVDVKEDYLIDIDKIEKAVSKKTKAIVVVHLYGKACDMDTIKKISDKHGLKIIEDCAQSHGAKYKGKLTGSFGDVGCFSFYPTKNLGAMGDGGMIVTNDKMIAESCKELRMYGIKKDYHAEYEGWNSRLDELQASILRVKLPKLPLWNKRRKEIAMRYMGEIKNSNISLPLISNTDNHAFHLFVIRVKNRDALIAHLKKHEIGFGIHYPYPIHEQIAYKNICRLSKKLDNSEKYAKEILSLPIFPELKEEEINHIIKTLNSFSLR